MKAMIFAAGLGTRLKPLTDHMPKALVPVGGRPLLDIVVDRLMQQGFDDFVVNIHHFADQIEAWSQDKPNVRLSDERELLLETGGAIRHARMLLSDAKQFLIHNVDILSNADLQELMQKNLSHDATLLVSQRETSRYLLFNDEMRLVGWTNVKTGEVKSPYPNLDVEHCQRLAFAGIHVMSSTMLPLMDCWPERFSIIDFYLDCCAEQKIYGYVQPNLRLMDVGKVDTLQQAETFIKTLEA